MSFFVSGGFKPASSSLLILLVLLVLFTPRVEAFGAGNIASISSIEGKNWRHGDIEDMLQTLAFIKGHKWSNMMIKRVYFGNWLRDYSQAMDTGTLQKVQADTIRILVWVLSFMSCGYATAEFEVTAERLGVYRPEEHIDNPKDYADNEDARKFDARLRGPVRPIELEIDPETGMKNYIANERGDWATSAGYVKYSFARSIHFGRLYTNGGKQKKGNEEDLCEALRCLGQGLHTLEDFGAHSNYVELVLREMGYRNVFPHTGVNTMMNFRGHQAFPIVTGTFGMVDFFHSVLGEATDHLNQSELDEMDNALVSAGQQNAENKLTGLLGKIPGTGDLVNEAHQMQQQSNAQAQANQREVSRGGGGGGYGESSRGFFDTSSSAHHNSSASQDRAGIPSVNIDPQKTIQQIYPFLEFRDKVVRRISAAIEKIPGLSALLDKISETVTIFIFSLLAPYIRPIIKVATSQLHSGSSGVVNASAQHQYEPWTDPTCTDPTHSLLSKDHFSNILNEPAGAVASEILKFVVPCVLYAWQHVDIPVERVLNDCVSVLHHPALRDRNNQAHQNMFETVEKWARDKSQKGKNLDSILSADSVKEGRNNTVGGQSHGHGHGPAPSHQPPPSQGYGHGGYGHSHGPSASHQPPPSQAYGHGGYGHSHSSSTSHQPAQSHGYGHSQGYADSSGHSYGQSHGHSQSQSHGGFGGIPGLSNIPGASHIPGLSNIPGLGGGNQQQQHQQHQSQHSSSSSSTAQTLQQLSNLPIPGMSKLNKLSHFVPGGNMGGGSSREIPDEPGSGDNNTQAGGTTTHDYYDQTTQYQQQQQQPYAGEQQYYAPPQGSYDAPEFNMAPPPGYEQYQPPQDGVSWPEYQPPSQGAHTYDYYYGPPQDHGYNQRY